MKLKYVFYILLVFTGGCKKRPPAKQCKNMLTECCCKQKEDNTPKAAAFIYKWPLVTYPVFNPNNSNEFAYIYWSSGVRQIRKHIISSNVNFVIKSFQLNQSPSKLDWGKNNWIIYFLGNKLFKTHAITGETIQLTNDSLFSTLNPNWVENNNIIYQYYNSSKTTPTTPIFNRIIKVDENGNFLDSISNINFLGANASNNTNTFIHLTQKVKDFYTIDIYDLTSKTDRTFYSFVAKEFGFTDKTGILMQPTTNNAYFATYSQGLFKINLNTQELTKILDFCCNEYRIESFDISNDGQKIIQGRETHLEGLNYEKSLYITNQYGKEEEQIFIP